MKIFLRDIFCFALLQVLVIGGIIGGFHRPAFKDPVMAATRIKHQRLRDAAPPRIVVIGGSNVLYGLDGPTLGEQLPGYEPVNMGLVGGLRLDYMLNEVEPHVGDGDIVVLALEYRALTRQFSGRQSAVTLMQLLAVRPANVRYLGLNHLREIGDNGVIPHAGYMLKDAVDNLRHFEIKQTHREINTYGDLIDHRGKPPKKGVARHKPMPRKMSPEIEAVMDDSIARINAFTDRCNAKGVTVLYSYPPLPDRQFSDYAEMIDAFAARVSGGVECPIINAPGDMVFPLGQFYDTSYHLGGAGAIERSKRLAQAVRTHLANANESLQPAQD